MNTNHRAYYICYQPDIHSLTHVCKPVGEEKNLAFFKEDADVKYICKYIPLEFRKTLFEQKYPGFKVLSVFEK